MKEPRWKTHTGEFWKAELRSWLSGTTCSRRKKEIVHISHSGRLAVFKHFGHTQYIGRFSPNVWCGTYYCLRDAENLDPKSSGWDHQKSIRTWKGQWTKAMEKELTEEIARVENNVQS